MEIKPSDSKSKARIARSRLISFVRICDVMAGKQQNEFDWEKHNSHKGNGFTSPNIKFGRNSETFQQRSSI